MQKVFYLHTVDQAQATLWAMRTNHKARELLAHKIPSLLSPLKRKILMGPKREEKRKRANLYQANQCFSGNSWFSNALLFQGCVWWEAVWMVQCKSNFHSCGTLKLIFVLPIHQSSSDTLSAWVHLSEGFYFWVFFFFAGCFKVILKV